LLTYLSDPSIKLSTVSGIWSTKPNIIRWIDDHVPEIDIITTKSFQVHPNPGNREPIITEKAVGTYSNAVGLRNPGMVKVHAEFEELLQKPLNSLLNISISGSSPEEFVQLVQKFEDFADIFELNFSCPHAKPGYGSTIGSSTVLVKEYMEAIRQATDKLIFPKLTPNVDNIGKIADICKTAGADGIAAINTWGPEQVIEPHSGEPILYNPSGRKGGISGEEIFPIALKKISEIREAIGPDLPILGMGGVSTPANALEMKKAGAQIIGLGSLFARIKFQDRIQFMKEFRETMKEKRTSVTIPFNDKRQTEYHPYKISEINELSPTMRIFKLQGDHKMTFTPSQYAFLWLPDFGEKPFSIVNDSPLEFIIRKRERNLVQKNGIFTEALFNLKVGDDIYARG
ncbi:MAG: tRNA-dihydrouridine synthase, partial [Candidatus Marinimicrobia bacterium]|nr:tRNA-dihydrouridine synthase [Candidatus Neomarinimicrobiota bacterium]